jgi:hypothetical protein
MARQLARDGIVFSARGHEAAHAVAHFLDGGNTLREQAHLAVDRTVVGANCR